MDTRCVTLPNGHCCCCCWRCCCCCALATGLRVCTLDGGPGDLVTDAGISTGAACWWLLLPMPPLGVMPWYSSSHTTCRHPTRCTCGALARCCEHRYLALLQLSLIALLQLICALCVSAAVHTCSCCLHCYLAVAMLAGQLLAAAVSACKTPNNNRSRTVIRQVTGAQQTCKVCAASSTVSPALVTVLAL
jgi:hypothetical protein